MIINRHNYEESFLLYVDNELSLADRIAVETFVQKNPDLRQELVMLQEAVLPGEDIFFNDKAVLYARSAGISIENYEEYFLLSIDNELDERQEEEVENFVLKHPALQPELALLKQTRLEPETVLFEQKDLLYRKEGKDTRVIFLSWMRISAAAAIVGLITLTWYFTHTNGHPTDPAFAVKKINTIAPLQKKAIQLKPVAPADAIALSDKTEPVNEKGSMKRDASDAVTASIKKNELAANKHSSKPSKKAVTNDKTQEAANEGSESAQALATLNSGNKNNLPSISENPLNTNMAVNHAMDHTSEVGSSLATPAVYQEVDNREDEDKDFYIGSVDINKNKLKGLFKKAANFFSKKADKNDRDRTVQIAGFEIKSK